MAAQTYDHAKQLRGLGGKQTRLIRTRLFAVAR